MQGLKPYDCLIVGGDAAGMGMVCALQELGVERFGTIERGESGSFFLMWPWEMRMIAPAFTSNACDWIQGMMLTELSCCGEDCAC